MPDIARLSAANGKWLKVIFGLAGIFVLVLVGMRLMHLAAFARAVADRVPLLRVEPEIPADCAIVVALLVAPFAFALPRAWRVRAWFALLLVTLVAVVMLGNAAAKGGTGTPGTALANWLQSRGYARCAAGDMLRGAGRATRGTYVAEGWAQPGACPARSISGGQ